MLVLPVFYPGAVAHLVGKLSPSTILFGANDVSTVGLVLVLYARKTAPAPASMLDVRVEVLREISEDIFEC